MQMGVSPNGVPESLLAAVPHAPKQRSANNRFAASCCTLLPYPGIGLEIARTLDTAPECRMDADEWHRVLRPPPRGVVSRPIRSVLIGGWSPSADRGGGLRQG